MGRVVECSRNDAEMPTSIPESPTSEGEEGEGCGLGEIKRAWGVEVDYGGFDRR